MMIIHVNIFQTFGGIPHISRVRSTNEIKNISKYCVKRVKFTFTKQRELYFLNTFLNMIKHIVNVVYSKSLCNSSPIFYCCFKFREISNEAV